MVPRLARSLLSLLAAGALTTSPPRVGAAAPAVAGPTGACAGAGTATNSVVRFYLAVDRRQFAAASGCLAPSEQAALPYSAFVAGYTTTVSSRLVVADSGASNGAPVNAVTVDLHAVDRTAGGLVARTFMGQWRVDTFGRLTHGTLRVARAMPVRVIPPTNVADIFAYLQQEVLSHVRADVTADGVPDDIYLTSGQGCGSCHAQQIYVYSRGRLVYQQQADDAEIQVYRGGTGMEIRTDTPGSPGLDSCCPSSRTYEEWGWTPDGFVLRGQRIVSTSR